MTDSVRQKAREDAPLLAEVEAHELALPEERVTPLSEASDALAAEIERAKAELDLTDTGSIVSFGASAQSDLGPAGDSLRDIVTAIRGFSAEELDAARKPSLWDRILGRAKPMAKFAARYEEVQGQIDRITDNLLSHEHTLLKDIKALDLLYDKTLGFYDALAIYIAAGEAKLSEVDTRVIPEAEKKASDGEGDDVLDAQALRDLRAARDDLERRVHDLKLTRQVTMQSLPSIRLVQENDKALVTRINSTLVNTVPLWETQLAQALTIQRSAAAAGAVKEASDLTNDLLTANAENLKTANREIREEIERGAFDIEAVSKANADLIATIEDSLRIADEGKSRRAAAEEELKRMEAELKETLAAAKARETAPAETGGTA